MKKLLSKIFFLSILTIVILRLGEHLFIKEDRFNFTNYNFNRIADSTDFGIIFFGSSKSYCSYNPTIFKQNLGLNSYNLAGQGQVLEVTNFVFGETLKKTKPKLVVVDLSYGMIEFNKVDSIAERAKSFQLKIFDNYKLSFNKLKYIYNIYDKKDIFFASSPMIRNHDKWINVNKKFYKKEFIRGKNNMFLSNNGYIGTMHKINQSGLKIAEKMNLGYNTLKNQRKLTISDEEIEIIKNLAKEANQRDVTILFVTTPSIKGFINHLSFYHDLEIIMKELQYDYINLNKYFDEIGLETSDFKDVQHMNYSGGFKTSQFLSKYIAKNYDLKPKAFSNDLDNNITYHLLTNMKNTKELLTSKFNFNDSFIIDQIGYFEEADNIYSFIFKLNKSSDLDIIDGLRGYIRYYNGEINDKNKLVEGFPLKLIDVNDELFYFARINIEDLKISKLDFFLIEKNSSNASKFLTFKNITLE